MAGRLSTVCKKSAVQYIHVQYTFIIQLFEIDVIRHNCYVLEKNVSSLRPPSRSPGVPQLLECIILSS